MQVYIGDIVYLKWPVDFDYGYSFARVTRVAPPTASAKLVETKILSTKRINDHDIEALIVPGDESVHSVTLKMIGGGTVFKYVAKRALGIEYDTRRYGNPKWSLWDGKITTCLNVCDQLIKIL
jgi:hypothetical protein